MLVLFIALVLTILIEMAVAYFLGVRNKKDLFNIFFINGITNPLLNGVVFFGGLFIDETVLAYLFVMLMEIGVVCIEYIYFKQNFIYNKMNLFKLSFILNVCSFGTGIVYFLLF